MAAFLMYWSVLSVVGVFLAVIMVRSGHTEESQGMSRVPAQSRTTPPSQ